MPTALSKKSNQKFGEKSTTVRDVAREAGVGTTTVSLVLRGQGNISESTRREVMEVARRLGYSVNSHAQRLRQGRCNNLIGLYCDHLDLGVLTSKVDLIQNHLIAQGWDVPIYASGSMLEGKQERQINLIERLCQQKPRAIVCDIADLPDAALDSLRFYQDEGGVVVAFDQPTDLPCDRVIFDREDNTYQAARHLIELGHRDIGAFFIGFPNYEDDQFSGPRVRGFERALQQAGLTRRNDWTFWGWPHRSCALELAEKFLALPDKPSAICIVNDGVAATFVAQMQRAGYTVPEHVSVVGQDNLDIAADAAVALTTVSQPVERTAQTIVEMVTSRLDGSYEGPFREIVLRGELVVRDSATLLTGTIS